MEHVYNLSGVIAINAGFSFAADVCAQLLEGHRCCLPDSAVGDDDDDAPERATPEFATGDTLETDGGGGRALLASTSLTVASNGNDEIEVEKDKDGSPARWDWRRTGMFTLSGVVVCGVFQFVRLTIIQDMYGGMEPTTMLAFEKTAVNQLIFSPVHRVVAMALLHYTKTGDTSTIPAKLKKDFWEAQGVSWGIEPASNLVAFLVFPTSIVGQAIVLRAAAFGYSVYFSYVTHREIEEERAVRDASNDNPSSVEGGGGTGEDTSAKETPSAKEGEPATVMTALSHGVNAPFSCA